MPLHLLGKKSWNVYNTDNVARVRRDEAEAQRREEEAERHMQEVDAERRLNILRGLPIPEATEPADAVEPVRSHRTPPDLERKSKKRKLAGEDDTDRDIRLAKFEAESKHEIQSRSLQRRPSIDVPLTGQDGHINLFPQKRTTTTHPEKNEEAEQEADQKRRDFEDQYTLRFSNAAGIKQPITNPWYSTIQPSTSTSTSTSPTTKDVWGNDDPSRHLRDQARITANDPLATIKRGVRQLKETEKQRAAWKAERDLETSSVLQVESSSRSSESRKRRAPRHQHDHHHHSSSSSSRHRTEKKHAAPSSADRISHSHSSPSSTRHKDRHRHSSHRHRRSRSR